jgi:hypothetical protein
MMDFNWRGGPGQPGCLAELADLGRDLGTYLAILFLDELMRTDVEERITVCLLKWKHYPRGHREMNMWQWIEE